MSPLPSTAFFNAFFNHLQLTVPHTLQHQCEANYMDLVPQELYRDVLWRTLGAVSAASLVFFALVSFLLFGVLPRYKVPQKPKPGLLPRRSFLSRSSFEGGSASASPENSPLRRNNGFYQQLNNSSRYLRRDSFGAEL